MSGDQQSPAEEIANSVSHGLGLLAAIAAAPLLLFTLSREGKLINVVAGAVFATTMVLLYLASTIYHALPPGRIKQLFLKLDHAAIYLFIAGSYTPFALGVLKGTWGWTLFGLVWGLAMTGLLLRSLDRLDHPYLATGLYLAMGWMVVGVAWPLFQRLPSASLYWLVAGGVAYTLGVVFFLLDGRLRFGHLVWHLFVMAGSTCHFLAVLWHIG